MTDPATQPATRPSLSRGWAACIGWGGFAGVCLGAILVAWVVVANRAPLLESFAQQRNLAAVLGIGVFMLLLCFRFLKSPPRIFFAGSISWTLLTGSYIGLGGFFPRLEQRLSAFHLFLLGVAAFALAAAVAWVAERLVSASLRRRVRAGRAQAAAVAPGVHSSISSRRLP